MDCWYVRNISDEKRAALGPKTFFPNAYMQREHVRPRRTLKKRDPKMSPEPKWAKRPQIQV
jgi:hypothetical protein